MESGGFCVFCVPKIKLSRKRTAIINGQPIRNKIKQKKEKRKIMLSSVLDADCARFCLHATFRCYPSL